MFKQFFVEQDLPPYIYEGLWSIEGNPNRNKKNTFLLFLSFHPFIPLSYFSNPNFCSSFVSMVNEGILDGLLMLGQTSTRSPWRGPTWVNVWRFLVGSWWDRSDQCDTPNLTITVTIFYNTSIVYLSSSSNSNANPFFEYYLNKVLIATCKGTSNFLMQVSLATQSF
jgi:hypothetical protein